jgi:mannose-6-phosphate isomerase
MGFVSNSKTASMSTAVRCEAPLKLVPRFVERVWGVDDVSRYYPNHKVGVTPIGEVWLTGEENVIASEPGAGSLAGKTLNEVTRICDRSLLGAQMRPHPSGKPVFPLLIKFLFTSDKLSVQLHPPDAAAPSGDDGSWGKTEMWHVLDAQRINGKGASLAVGFMPEARETLRGNPELLRAAIANGSIEQMLDWRDVQPGESYYVPAGTVHAIGAGLTICEIQQNSDITYRLYDYNRPGTDGKPRALHVEEGIAVMAFESHAGLTRPVEMSRPPLERRLLAACPLFATERCEARATQVHLTENRMETWVGLEGTLEMRVGDLAKALEESNSPQATARSIDTANRTLGTSAADGALGINAANGALRLCPGEAIVVPADVPWVQINPSPAGTSAQFLRVYIPNAEDSLREALRLRGVPLAHLRRVCFS